MAQRRNGVKVAGAAYAPAAKGDTETVVDLEAAAD